jgi:hypothetical protein
VSKANKHHVISDKIKVVDIYFPNAKTLSSFSFETMSFDMDEQALQEYIDTGYNTIKKHFEKQS